MIIKPLNTIVQFITELIEDYIALYIENIINHGLLIGLALDTMLFILSIETLSVVKHLYNRIHNTPEKIGDRYEKTVIKVLRKYLRVNPMRSLLLPCSFTPLGKTEADIVFVNRKGVFCCECKHRSFDDASHTPHIKYTSKNWILDSSRNIELYNPFEQNKTHIAAIIDNVPLSRRGVYNMAVVNFFWVFSYMGLEFKAFEDKGLASLDGIGVFLLTVSKNYFFSIATKLFDPGIVSLRKHMKSMPDIYTNEEVKQLYLDLKKYEGNTKDLKKFKADQKRLGTIRYSVE